MTRSGALFGRARPVSGCPSGLAWSIERCSEGHGLGAVVDVHVEDDASGGGDEEAAVELGVAVRAGSKLDFGLAVGEAEAVAVGVWPDGDVVDNRHLIGGVIGDDDAGGVAGTNDGENIERRITANWGGDLSQRSRVEVQRAEVGEQERPNADGLGFPVRRQVFFDTVVATSLEQPCWFCAVVVAGAGGEDEEPGRERPGAALPQRCTLVMVPGSGGGLRPTCDLDAPRDTCAVRFGRVACTGGSASRATSAVSSRVHVSPTIPSRSRVVGGCVVRPHRAGERRRISALMGRRSPVHRPTGARGRSVPRSGVRPGVPLG
jgi:hypothetical protein